MGEFKKILPALEHVELETGQVLWEAEDLRTHVYFPTTAMIALLYDSHDGVSVQIAITGRLGLVGVSTFMSGISAASRAVVYREGEAYRMNAVAVREEFGECGDFQDICMYFTQTLINQIAQTAICNRLHSVEQQLCRFMLYMHDISKYHQSDIVLLTHEQIAQALGVRRETISLAARTLQDRGLIEYSRGRITVLDRQALSNFACECYHVDTEHYQCVLGKYIAKHA